MNSNVLEDKAIKLTNEEYEYHINNIDKPESKEMLFRSHIKWALRISRNYRSNRFTRDEIDAEGLVGLWIAIQQYDPNRGGVKLITFATPVIRNHIIKYIRKYVGTPKDEYLNVKPKAYSDRGDKSEEIIDLLPDDEDCIKNQENKTIFNSIIDILPDILNEKELKVFIGYYVKNKRQTDLQEELGITQVQVSRILKRVRDRVTIYLATGNKVKRSVTYKEVEEALSILTEDKEYFI